MPPPVIGITVDVSDGRCVVSPSYGERVAACGGVPILLPPRLDMLETYLEICDGFLLTGGDDPSMEAFGIPTHPRATPIAPERQAFELELLRRCEERRELPVLGVCLGMQLMSLVAGGSLDQHLPDTLPSADRHWGRREHPIAGDLGAGTVHSHHRQAVTDPGALRVVATAPDAVIEAVRCPDRPFYLGVQWHPERTTAESLGIALNRELVEEAGRSLES